MSAELPNKAKMAIRVIEVLEFFDEEHPSGTVMDIARHAKRPQSSTSDLVQSLQNLGMLYNDPGSRHYSLTPHAALIGTAAQPEIVRDGRLTRLVDRLSAQTGLHVAIFGMVGSKVQIFRLRRGIHALSTADPAGFKGGKFEHLCDSAAGLLLLSTIAQPRRDCILRRLNAEASPGRKFSFPEMVARVRQCGDQKYVTGKVGFGSTADVTAVLLPDQTETQPLAIGFVYEPSGQAIPSNLVQSLHVAVARCIDGMSWDLPDTLPLLGSVG